jgi:hypothetical protein
MSGFGKGWREYGGWTNEGKWVRDTQSHLVGERENRMKEWINLKGEESIAV